MHRYVKTLSLINEENTQAKSLYDAALQKYEQAKLKDAEQYKSYTEGNTNKDQYLNSFNQFLDVEREFRLAQVKFKLDSSRSEQTADNTPAGNANNQQPNGNQQPSPGQQNPGQTPAT